MYESVQLELDCILQSIFASIEGISRKRLHTGKLRFNPNSAHLHYSLRSESLNGIMRVTAPLDREFESHPLRALKSLFLLLLVLFDF